MSNYSNDKLNDIYDRTSGYCHICGKKLAFSNYGKFGRRGAWEVEHSIPRAAGGTDHLNNLYAACISCNREKQDVSTRAARAQYGRSRAPLSREKRRQVRMENTIAGGTIGGAIGLLIGGRGGALVGGGIGAAIGNAAALE